MLRPDEIRAVCERRYPVFLRSMVTDEPFFPLQIPFGRPSSGEDWVKLEREISTLDRDNVGYRIEWEEIRTRRWGLQKLPRRVWVDDEAAYVRLLRCKSEVAAFREMLAATRSEQSALIPWLAENAKWAVEHSEPWPGLLKVCAYFLANPRPNQFARELPIAVDSKFIERHRSILRSLLDHLLPVEVRTDDSDFERRFGLRFDEPLVHLRLLDSRLKDRLQLCVDSFAAPVSQLAELDWRALTVLIVENKKTYLTLPQRADTVGLFGGGAAAELLASFKWLTGNRLLYWGDLDTHGFHILSRLRRVFPYIESLMMDSMTFEQFRPLCGAAKQCSYEETAGLTPTEQAVYRILATENLLLEQEKLPHEYVLQTIAAQI